MTTDAETIALYRHVERRLRAAVRRFRATRTYRTTGPWAGLTGDALCAADELKRVRFVRRHRHALSFAGSMGENGRGPWHDLLCRSSARAPVTLAPVVRISPNGVMA